MWYITIDFFGGGDGEDIGYLEGDEIRHKDCVEEGTERLAAVHGVTT